MPSDVVGGQPGDLYVTVRSLPDERFERVGNDLWRHETIAVADAVLGTQLKVPSLTGMVDVTVPPGTQPDAVLRLRGKGMSKFGDTGHGNLNIRIHVQIPEKLSAEERGLYEQLRTVKSARALSLNHSSAQKRPWWHFTKSAKS